MHKRLRRIVVGGIVSGVIIAGYTVAFVERNAIFDWSRLHNYTAPQTVAQLASQTTMTKIARTLFYINHPVLDDKVAFDKVCPPGGEKTIVLGCYHPLQQGIYLYRVTDPQLDGVEQVTAAHEMLHAAYDRLSSHERTYVDGLLENYYQHDLHDPQVLAEIAAYKKSEPHDVVNEMHSVFGTEIANLPAPLERYYKQYFTDRHKITQYAADYRTAFTTREAEVSAYDKQRGTLKAQINTDEAKLGTQLTAIHTASAQLSAERASGDISAYNSGVASYNTSIDHYNALLTTTKQRIASYNTIVVKRNALAFEEQRLSQELSSSPISASH